MRDGLQPFIGQRIMVSAPVHRFGTRTAWTGAKLPTVLLSPIRDMEGHKLADHLWLHVGKQIAALDLKPGDVLTFTGRVKPYTHMKRQHGASPIRFESDLGLANPSNCRIAARAWSPPSLEEINELSIRARVLFALAVIAVEGQEPPTLTKLMARSGVAPLSLLSVLKRLGNMGDIVFSPSGRVMLTHVPTRTVPVIYQ